MPNSSRRASAVKKTLVMNSFSSVNLRKMRTVTVASITTANSATGPSGKGIANNPKAMIKAQASSMNLFSTSGVHLSDHKVVLEHQSIKIRILKCVDRVLRCTHDRLLHI